VPIVCVNRPNRTNPRKFTAKDVARISRYAAADGSAVPEIIAGVLVALGLGYVVCALSRAIDNTLGILGIIKQLAALLAGAALTRALLAILERGLGVPIPPLRAAIVGLITLVLAIQALSKGAAALVSDLETIEDAASTIHDWCSNIKGILPGA